MKIPFRALSGSICQLGAGELVARLSNIAIVVLLGRRYGIVVLGVYSLAQTLIQYLQPLIDFGLRHVGARLLALYPHAACEIVERVQRRRLRVAVLVLPLILAYSRLTKVPAEMKLFIFVFSAAGILYAASLDWAAWGWGRMRIVGLAKSIVPVSILACLLMARPPGDRVLWYAVAGNCFGFLLQGAIFWAWWKRQPFASVQDETGGAIGEALAWRRTSVMGVAWLCNLAFNTIDVLMLGVMSNPEQIGLYGAAYRVLNQALATYYVFTQVLYPRFARLTVEGRARMLEARILLPLLGAGLVLAGILSISGRVLLSVVFGHPFLAAGPLLLVLAWSLPLDFLTSYLSNAFIAWGMEKQVLLCTAVAASANIVCNLVLIPHYGASGAAISTLFSYGIFLACLHTVGRTVKPAGTRTRPVSDAMPKTLLP